MNSKINAASDVGQVWESIYSEGKALNRYPFDQVVTFLYRNYSRSKPRSETKILEIGCGAGNNLWFAAREGFTVAGVDGSPSAIQYAQQRFTEDGLSGDFRIADFTNLPHNDNLFDFVIDRGSLTCSTFKSAQKAVAEVHRVLAPGGRFFCNPYSDRHTSFMAGKASPDGRTIEITDGTAIGVGAICFYSKRDILSLFSEGWKLISLRHLEFMEELQPHYTCHAEWIAIAEKV